MAGAGKKTFTVGEVLTASDVNGYLMDQAVMRFADSGARGSAIGTATEGMVSYLDDTDAVEVYDGSAWTALGGGGFTAATAITATDASWSVPTLADPVVRVIVIGGGGGGSSGNAFSGFGGAGTDGGNSSFASSAGTATANGGALASSSASTPRTQSDGWVAWNGGDLGRCADTDRSNGRPGFGGEVTVAYFDLSGVTTASVTIGAGGTGGTGNGQAGGDGGDGVVIFEYRAG